MPRIAFMSCLAVVTLASAAAAPVLADSPLIIRPGTPLPPAKDGYSYPECFCTDSVGQRVEIGERACLTINSRSMSAVCGMSLNNPAWRMDGEDCAPTS